ncbi:tyrosine-type recombinase/integrase [Pontibacter fetidus]|uniref:Tyrosine-type recombinase/integrase n=1 Tax=Pontibacter fetidus TaxID=2700082 RepID=A0A6B2H3A4_9BACT|nr:tyrosine-type recombinase/integrase [Pontibacter fetidus]NDK54787.1 tyrosine-type recombinase/integrase [Pontibacter fetidus]
MFTDPQIYNPTDLTQRGFISFYFNGRRCRYYNGKAINISCFPNTSKTHTERGRLLKRLLREYTRTLLKGWTPEAKQSQPLPKPVHLSLVELLARIVKEVETSAYSRTYKRDITSVKEKFKEFIEAEGKQHILTSQVTSADIERFLQQFSSSGTYYQNKRRTLAAVFSKLVKQGYCQSNPVLATSKRKAKAVLHQAYTPDQLSKVLPFLQEHYPNLFLCALLMYGVLLRPHQEIRLLQRRHFNKTLSQLTLEGSENKSGRIRTMPVPVYVREELQRRGVDQLQPDNYIVSGTGVPYNESYFNTMWSRAKNKMLLKRLINVNQTLYSFRHAASVNVFGRTQNLKLLQQLLGHTSLTTSLTYLRSLGMIQIDHSVMPELLEL